MHPVLNRRLGLLALAATSIATAGLGTIPQANAQVGTYSPFSSEAAATTGQTVASPTTGVLTSGFGARWGTTHTGIDIANSIGTPIYSVMDGTVISSGPASGYGQWIRVQHDDGSMSIYGHMEYLYVSVGERVYAGQEIAGMGSRGFSTGSHLHFEIHPAGSGNYGAVDPQTWLANNGIYF
ncbi:M23 family metallopeptidase [Corynebacterium callunae]|uniref:M23 family metallopeptidase n=1 Tax=Corynebacterium callunae TaxID=1721 RepID=UPI0039825430